VEATAGRFPRTVQAAGSLALTLGRGPADGSHEALICDTGAAWRYYAVGLSVMATICHLMPRQRVPDLSLPLTGGGSWRLSDQKPKHFTMLAFYRGLHCSVCRDYLAQLQSMHAAFSKQGVTPIAISMDAAVRASASESNWGLRDLCVAYGLALRQAREWGLYVSRGAGRSSLGIEEPPMFVEPALFLVRPDRTLYYASVQSMPFARPCFKEMLSGIEKAVARDTPARGELRDQRACTDPAVKRGR
jgi:peroxiredoxin